MDKKVFSEVGSSASAGTLFAQRPQLPIRADAELSKLSKIIHEVPAVYSFLQDTEVVLIIGSTGVGKSTLVNYLAGKQLELDTSSYADTVTCKEPLAIIGHGRSACTDRPQLYRFDMPSLPSLTLCDCPGFFDNRGTAAEAANALAIHGVAKHCKKIKGLILVLEYSAFVAERGNAVEKALESTMNFLGPMMSQYMDSVFFLLSKVPKEKVSRTITYFEGLSKDSGHLPYCKQLLERGNFGMYCPLDTFLPENGVFDRSSLLNKMINFPGIPNSDQAFNIALSYDAQLDVTTLLNIMEKDLRNTLKRDDLQSVGTQIKLIHELKLLNVKVVTEEIEKLDDVVSDLICLYENKDATALKVLQVLYQVMPEKFKEIIALTFNNLKMRLDNEAKIAQEREAALLCLTQNQQQLVQLQSEQKALVDSLNSARINQTYYAQKSNELSLAIQNAQKNEVTLKSQLSSLSLQLETIKSNAESSERRIRQELEGRIAEANSRASYLSSQLDDLRRQQNQRRQETIEVTILQPIYGMRYLGI